jgi:uncharacterized protein (TIGR03663 family)
LADIALPRNRGDALNRPFTVALDWAIANWQVLALAGIVMIAAALRLWDLGSRAIHHDESLHAEFSWYLYQGRGYVHDPLMHGPFQFHINALNFFLFGASDYTARLPHALFGTALVAMPVLLRKQIGMRAVLIAATFIAFSPTLLFFSRFDREDIYTIVWTFATVICLWRYLDEGKDIWLYGMAGALALSFATKETTYITVAIMMIFLDIMLAVELGKPREGERIDAFSRWSRTVTLAPIAWLLAAFLPLIGRKLFGRDRLPRAADAIVVIGTLSLPMFSAAIKVLRFVGNKGYNVPQEDSLRVTTVLVLLVASAYVGLMWRPKQWLIAAVCFWLPFVLLYTTFFTNQPAPWTSGFWHGHGGFFSGTWGSLDYWLEQQGVKRGNQPFYYYGLVTPLYEFLPLVLTLGGAVWLALKGSGFQRWLLFWLGATFIGLSMAGEKMPWLEVHLALPLALAGGICLGRAVDGLEFDGRWLRTAALALAATAGTYLAVEFESPARFAGLFLLGTSIGWAVSARWIEGTKGAARAALTVVVAVLFALTVRAGVIAALDHGDIPVEMLVYTQTSPEVVQIRDRIDALATKSGMGLNLPIVVDGTDGFSWPWAWYLRDYHAVSYVNVTPGYAPPPNAVLLINQSSIFNVDTAGFSQTRFIHRWWFPETYRGLTLSKLGHIVTSGHDLRGLAHFFLYRRQADPYSSVNAIALFPENLAAFDVRGTAATAAGPVAQPDGRIIVGGPGAGHGQFDQPAGLFVDADGNIWVADSRNGRIQKFDAEGNFSGGIERSPTAQFNEPWSLAVDRDGTVYVADTWNHRILRFSPALNFVGTWGVPAINPNPNEFELFGPRAIVFAPDGSLWVSDTGNKRLINYSRDGKALGVFGSTGNGPGQFNEQVGIAFDRAGNLYVADTWNGRIQKFGPGMTQSGQFPAPWTSQGVVDKPYLAVLEDGRIVASDPGSGDLLLYAATGAQGGKWHPGGNAKPLGVAPLPGGGFVYSDAGTNQLQLVPARAIAGLFR